VSGAARPAPAGDFDYEAHGAGYAAIRRPDPRIAAQVHAALGAARTVVNVGAGAGSYEPEDRAVVAVEPSATMRAQRPRHRLPAVDATAERLPFDDGAFDAAMAMITIHQWSDLRRGLGEMRRVARGPVVILTFDGAALDRLWLAGYAPEIVVAEARRMPPIDRVLAALGGTGTVAEVPIPHDCTDGFMAAHWRRPHAYLDPRIREGISVFHLLPADEVEQAVAQLRADLDSGAWERRYADLLDRDEIDLGFRVIVAEYAGR